MYWDRCSVVFLQLLLQNAVIVQCNLPYQQVDPPVTDASGRFGEAVDISGDHAIVGAGGENQGVGAAYFYANSPSGWIYVDRWSPGIAGAATGTSVAIDGTRAVIGSPNGLSPQGSVHFFQLSMTLWEEVDTIEGLSLFGAAVDISGASVIVGAPSFSGTGSVYFYRYSDNAIQADGNVTLQEGLAEGFGTSVSISGDYAVVGARNFFDGDQIYPSVFVYHRVGPSNWILEETILKELLNGVATFGQSVGIENNQIIVGDPREESIPGSAFLYTNNTGVWTEIVVEPSNYSSPGDLFGRSVNIHEGIAIVGSKNSPISPNGGSVALYNLVNLGIEPFGPSEIVFGPNSLLGIAVSTSGQFSIVGARDLGVVYFIDISSLPANGPPGFTNMEYIVPSTMATTTSSSSVPATSLASTDSQTITVSTTEIPTTEPTTIQNTTQITSNSNASGMDSDNPSGSLFGILISVIAFFVVVLVVVAVIFLVWRRKTSPEQLHDRQSLDSTYSTVDMSSVHDIDQLMVTDVIGKGQFGEVYLGQWNGTPCACKKLGSDDVEELTQEASLISKLSHPNIVMLLGIHTNSARETYLVFEYVSGGSLIDFLPKNKRRLTVKDLTHISIGTAQGMAYLESKKIVHRDLAARNILITEVSLEAKISDFGLSRSDLYQKSATSKIPVRWSAPEVLHQGMSTLKSDVFSFGVVLWEIFSFGKLPFEGFSNMEASQLICDETVIEKLAKPEMCPEKIYQLMIRCWAYEPMNRISFQDILLQLRSISQNPNGPTMPVQSSTMEQEIYM